MQFAQMVFKILTQLGYRTKLWKVLCPCIQIKRNPNAGRKSIVL